MSLTDLIRGKSAAGKFATATPATFATQEGERGRTVASVATVAVAESPQGQTTPPTKVGADDTATSFAWLIHFTERAPLTVFFAPEVTHAEALASYPDAVAAELFTPTIRQPSMPMTAEEESAIRAWLGLIGETDPAAIADVLSQCRRNPDVRDYFTGRAVTELPKVNPFADDLRTCTQCANLVGRRCMAADRGEIVASRNYEPIRGMLKRCEGYSPGLDDLDRRQGHERWPGLV